MKLANLAGRAVVVTDVGVIDVEQVSGGRFGPGLQAVYEDWDQFVAFAAGLSTDGATPFDQSMLGPPAAPRQVFAIGLNYRAHAEETGQAVSSIPPTFTKWPSSIAGPYADVVLSGDTVDWEVELVAVIGRRAERVAAADGWRHVAGLMVGQDISDRRVQRAAGAQFSLGKSFTGYGPIGPWLVTPDEVPDRDDLSLRCTLDGETVQDARTSDMIWSVPDLVAQLSAVLALLPGDIIFTGTPSGVGVAREPRRFLRPGQMLASSIEGIGTIANHIVAAP